MADLEGSYHLINEVQNYIHRNAALKEWSPVEVKMAFQFGKAQTKRAKLLLVDPPHPLADSHGHNPRTHIHLAQFISQLPLRPEEDGDETDKEAYATIILANFFPYKDVPLQGASLWKKIAYWRLNKPRGSLDDLALRMVDNCAQVRYFRGETNEMCEPSYYKFHSINSLKTAITNSRLMFHLHLLLFYRSRGSNRRKPRLASSFGPNAAHFGQPR